VDRAFVSLSQVILKVHRRCDLACDHCYVYEAADQSWRGRPAAAADQVIAQAAQRIAEHAAAPLMDLRPPRIDFLLPHATRDHPLRHGPGSGTEYADWLIRIFDQWLAEGCPARIKTPETTKATTPPSGRVIPGDHDHPATVDVYSTLSREFSRRLQVAFAIFF
jgi:hypothetical protein